MLRIHLYPAVYAGGCERLGSQGWHKSAEGSPGYFPSFLRERRHHHHLYYHIVDYCSGKRLEARPFESCERKGKTRRSEDRPSRRATPAQALGILCLSSRLVYKPLSPFYPLWLYRESRQTRDEFGGSIPIGLSDPPLSPKVRDRIRRHPPIQER